MRLDLHLHTAGSHDCLSSPEAVLERARRRGVQRIAVTDHDRLSVALALARRHPQEVIPGEEVKTAEGVDVIGLYLRSEIPGGTPALEVCRRIREQGGLVYLPHPYARGKGGSGRLVPRLVGEVDVVEVLNGRLSSALNRRARELARAEGLPGAAGSDAHTLREVGGCWVDVPDHPNEAEALRSALAEGRVGGRTAPPWVVVASTWAKVRKRLPGYVPPRPVEGSRPDPDLSRGERSTGDPDGRGNRGRAPRSLRGNAARESSTPAPEGAGRRVMEPRQTREAAAPGRGVEAPPGGAYRTPERRRADVAELVGRIRRADQVVLSTHINADGDGAGCQAALAHWLDREGVRTWILNPTPFPDLYRFLLPRRARVVPASAPEAEGVCYQADLGIVVDTSDKGRLGRIKPHLDAVPKVIVDHHPPGRKPIEGARLIDPSASAAGELVFDLLLAGADTITPEMAEALYVAVLTDTGSFRFSNATAGCFHMAGDLVARGARPDRLYRRVYGSPPVRCYHLLRAALGTLEVDEEAGVGWMTVPTEDYRRLDAEPADLEGFVDYPRSIRGVDVGILFRELDDGGIKISFRSNEEVDVNALARLFGGGGHERAAGAVVEGALAEVRERVVEEAVRAAREARQPDASEGTAAAESG